MGERIYKKIGFFITCFLDIIFPKASYCTVCKRILIDNKNFICSGCLTQIRFANHQCRRCGEIIDSFPCKNCYSFKGFYDEVYSVCLYEGLARDMILRLKYKDDRDISITMAYLIYDILYKNNVCYDFITYVPSSKVRDRKRGYNHSKLIAIEISNITGKPVKDILIRIKDTKPQVLFDGDARWYNVKDVFKCEEPVDNKVVLLVDDVVTTGATVSYCAKSLKEKGAKKVIVASFAKSTLC
ncbi:ComF family protein [Caloramator sp. E03]|uniref:ComF family protein n=1 Tax=Caloramator sp. E03 TaxID=2576307 RepID=UPI001110AF46|nr:phosphoribosyltransferase family protein [Caloramator sp. E03]QCX33927.1 ComF family protein [Caloramator sp. E03]